MITYHDEYGTQFDGPFGVGTFLGDQIVSFPTETSARDAALEACTKDDHTVTVYGPPRSAKGCGRFVQARKVATYKWADNGPHEV